ncbi:MAG: translation initiation factor [Candidatus Aenigmarchaeota archaeon]|nr:translation initiation factor [Candidatus Aenigmarchaeota archaeon]
MPEVCQVCGLPKDICICQVMAKEEAKIKVYTARRRFGKTVTIVDGVKEGLKETTKKFKSKLACGGTFKDGKIELQGDHKNKIKKILIAMGFNEEQIEVE